VPSGPGDGLLAEILARRGVLSGVCFGLVILFQQPLQGRLGFPRDS